MGQTFTIGGLLGEHVSSHHSTHLCSRCCGILSLPRTSGCCWSWGHEVLSPLRPGFRHDKADIDVWWPPSVVPPIKEKHNAKMLVLKGLAKHIGSYTRQKQVWGCCIQSAGSEGRAFASHFSIFFCCFFLKIIMTSFFTFKFKAFGKFREAHLIYFFCNNCHYCKSPCTPFGVYWASEPPVFHAFH